MAEGQSTEGSSETIGTLLMKKRYAKRAKTAFKARLRRNTWRML